MFKPVRPHLYSVLSVPTNQGVAARRFPRVRAVRAMVLIIADEPAAREIYGELFAMRGYDVTLAASARDGLRAARNRRIGVVVLAVATGATELRRKLTALRPLARVHVVGLAPLWCDLMSEAQPQLH